MNLTKYSVDIVVPIYNDEQVIDRLCETVFSVLGDKFKSIKLILVDDGSKDQSFAKAIENRKLNQNIEVIRLAGNFGQHRAILAGLRSTKSPFVAIMDSDLQDRPGDIPVLLQKMLEEDTPMP